MTREGTPHRKEELSPTARVGLERHERVVRGQGGLLCGSGEPMRVCWAPCGAFSLRGPAGPPVCVTSPGPSLPWDLLLWLLTQQPCRDCHIGWFTLARKRT